MTVLIIALVVALASSASDINYIRFLEEENHNQRVIINEYEKGR